MVIGECRPVGDGPYQDYHYVDMGSYEIDEYGTSYLVDAERPAILDTGTGKNIEYIIDGLGSLNIGLDEVAVIALTHVHLDHAGGTGYLLDHCPNAEVFVHQIGAPHLIDPSKLIDGTKEAVGDQWRYYDDPKPLPSDRVVELSDGDVIDLGDHILEVHHTPGHAPHHVVFNDPDTRIVKTGDAAGIWIPTIDRVYPTTPPPNFDLDQCMNDINLLKALDPKVLLFGHFGPATRETKLENYSSILLSWVEKVAEARRERDKSELVSYFFHRDRELVDAWGKRKARDEIDLNIRGVLHFLDG